MIIRNLVTAPLYFTFWVWFVLTLTLVRPNPEFGSSDYHFLVFVCKRKCCINNCGQIQESVPTSYSFSPRIGLYIKLDTLIYNLSKTDMIAGPSGEIYLFLGRFRPKYAQRGRNLSKNK